MDNPGHKTLHISNIQSTLSWIDCEEWLEQKQEAAAEIKPELRTIVCVSSEQKKFKRGVASAALQAGFESHEQSELAQKGISAGKG